MRVLIFSMLALVTVVAPNCAAAQEESSSTQREHEVDELGLTLIYEGEMEPKQFLKTTACVAGTSWQCTRETETHYIGTLSYPTANTVDYADQNAELPFLVSNLRIRKQDDLPIDLSKHQPAIVLRDPDPETPLSLRGDQTEYELIGFVTDATDTSANYSFLFQNNSELSYSPDDDEESDKEK